MVASFPLGERDVSDEFRIPQKLYGRDAPSAALGEAFERVAEPGTPELVALSGYAGIGKSSVVRELLRVVGKRTAGGGTPRGSAPRATPTTSPS